MRGIWLWGVAAIAAAGAGSGCDARTLDTMPDSGSPVGGGGGAPQDAGLTTEYRWGDVSIHVARTGATTGSMTLLVTDGASPATLTGTLTYAGSTAATTWNGAHVVSRHGCTGDPSLFAVEIYSCAAGSIGEVSPGCLAVGFDHSGAVRGSFVHPTGARCDVRAAQADIVLPQPTWMTGTGPEAASGRFQLTCDGADGTSVLLEAVFLLPQAASILTC